MYFDVITLFPDMFKALGYGILGRAIKRNKIILTLYYLRNFSGNKQGTVDDRPYGGGPGMVIRAEPLQAAIQAIESKYAQNPANKLEIVKTKIIYLSPQGRPFNQTVCKQLSTEKQLTLICGRYEGIDQRVVNSLIDEEYSIGDYVLSGGEFAAMVMIDAIVRLLPDILGNQASKLEESFYQQRLDHPHFTKPRVFNNNAVPEVLLSGDHEAIRRWRVQQALGQTYLKRPDLLKNLKLTQEEQQLLQIFINELGEKNE